jgi:serine/threonine-protein kinase
MGPTPEPTLPGANPSPDRQADRPTLAPGEADAVPDGATVDTSLSSAATAGPPSRSARWTVNSPAPPTADTVDIPPPRPVSRPGPGPAAEPAETLAPTMAGTNPGLSRGQDFATGAMQPTMAAPSSLEGPAPAPAAPGRKPRRFPVVPGYEILEELGRGGMGVVYKAYHGKLGRTVALKMILAGAHASDEQLARFEGEARAVAHLRHPNIVQVYNVDELDGLPFFSLEYLDGGTLAGEIDGKPLPPARAAGFAESLARAMHEAHRAGIVHRDLKPANVLLDRQGTPKITDFGIAKRLDDVPEENAGRSGSQTRTGAIMGTPSYMAPEQAWGRTESIGPPADQYALGAMLYEMLTGRPPFQGATALETLELVRKNEPVPPTQLQPKLPRDLETICLKALQKEANQRYADAGALADDLARFRDGQPILARPVGTLERAWRWSRRHPREAGLIGAAAGLLLAITTISSGAFLVIRGQKREISAAKGEAERSATIARRNERKALASAEAETRARGLAQRNAEAERRARDAADRSAAEALAARKVAEQQGGLALDAVGGLVTRVQNELRYLPGTQDARENILKFAAGKLDQLLASSEQEANRLDLTAAVASQKIGQIYQDMGQPGKALRAYTEMARVVERMAADAPGDLGVTIAMAKVHNTLGDLHLKQLGNAEAAKGFYEKALASREAWLKQMPDRADARVAVAVNHGLIADTLLRLGDIPAAYAHLETAMSLRDSLPPAVERTNRRLLAERAGLYDQLGSALIKRKRDDEGRAYFDRALEIRETLARGAGAAEQNNLYDSLCDLGHVALLTDRDPGRALGLYQKALDGLLRLSRDDPKNNVLARHVGLAHYYVGVTRERLDQPAEARAEFEKCREIRRRLADADPEAKMSQLELGLVLARCGDPEAAASLAAKVIALPPQDTRVDFMAACVYALAHAAAGRAGGTGADRPKYDDLAFARLDRAIAAGWADPTALQSDTDLDPIRPDPRFARCLEAVERAAKSR